MPVHSGNIKKSICLGLSAATGGLVAVLSDIMQKHEASAVEQLQITLGSIFGVHTYLWFAALLLIFLSVALSFIFGSDTNKTAFTTGAGILAFLVTVTPYKPLPNLDTAPPAAGTSAANIGIWDRLMIPGRVFAQSSVPAAASTPYTIHLQTADHKPVSEVVLTLIDPSNGQALRRSRVQGSDLTFYVGNGSYSLRVQVDGYQITEIPLTPPPHSVTVNLAPSSVPLALQRLFRK
jgi:hypothetical protein